MTMQLIDDKQSAIKYIRQGETGDEILARLDNLPTLMNFDPEMQTNNEWTSFDEFSYSENEEDDEGDYSEEELEELIS